MLQLVRGESNKHLLSRAHAAGKGVIIAAPHIGAWELMGLWLTSHYPMHFLYQPSRKPGLDQVLISSRERFGGHCHATSARGLKTLVGALKRGELIGILPDQEPALDHGQFADFFAQPAYTMTFLSHLARRHQATVVFAVMQRLPAGAGYQLHFLEPGTDLYSADESLATRELNRTVERCVTIAPEQYMWNYKRFRQTPPGGTSRYANDKRP